MIVYFEITVLGIATYLTMLMYYIRYTSALD